MSGEAFREHPDFDLMAGFALSIERCANFLYEEQRRALGSREATVGNPNERLQVAGVTIGANVLVALAAEIILKAWIGKTRSWRKKGESYPLNHDLRCLADTLNRDAWDMFSSEEEDFIRSTLAEHANDFRHWRYPYEVENLGNLEKLDEAMIHLIQILVYRYKEKLRGRPWHP